jgi:hypothetical protein
MTTNETEERVHESGGDKRSPRLLVGVALAVLALFALIALLMCAGLVVLFLRAEAEPVLPFLYAV